MAINLKEQLQQNFLAIISIIIAMTGLFYNSWRNELSEENRNFRSAGFEMIRVSANLQYRIDTATYAKEEHKFGPIDGWVRINVLISLSKLMSQKIGRIYVMTKMQISS